MGEPSGRRRELSLTASPPPLPRQKERETENQPRKHPGEIRLEIAPLPRRPNPHGNSSRSHREGPVELAPRASPAPLDVAHGGHQEAHPEKPSRQGHQRRALEPRALSKPPSHQDMCADRADEERCGPVNEEG